MFVRNCGAGEVSLVRDDRRGGGLEGICPDQAGAGDCQPDEEDAAPDGLVQAAFFVREDD